MFQIACISYYSDGFLSSNNSVDIYGRLEPTAATSLALGLIFLPLALLAITSNAFTVFAYIKDPYNNLKSAPSNLLITALATIDCFNGIISLLPSAVFYLLGGTGNKEFGNHITKWDTYSTTIKSTLQMAAMILFVAMTIDRYLAVTAPLKYKSRVTKARTLRVVAIIGFYCVILGCSLVIIAKCRFIYLIIYSSHVFLSLVVLAVMNVKIVLSVKKHSVLMRMRNTAASNASRLAFQRERKVTIAVSIVLAVFLLTFLPLFLQTIITLACNDKNCDLDVYAFQVAMYVSMATYHSSSASNPLLYSWRLDRYRQAFRYLIMKCCNRRGLKPSLGNAVALQ